MCQARLVAQAALSEKSIAVRQPAVGLRRAANVVAMGKAELRMGMAVQRCQAAAELLPVVGSTRCWLQVFEQQKVVPCQMHAGHTQRFGGGQSYQPLRLAGKHIGRCVRIALKKEGGATIRTQVGAVVDAAARCRAASGHALIFFQPCGGFRRERHFTLSWPLSSASSRPRTLRSIMS